MGYAIQGFNQSYAATLRKVIKNNKGEDKEIKIDCTDLVILRWFVSFFWDSEKVLIDNKKYVHLIHQQILDDLPILDICRKSCIARMKKLVELDVLEYRLITKDGTFSFYGFGKNYIKLEEV